MNLTGRYELGEPLGVGGTATVFRATHRGSGRQVAVKIFDARRPNCRSEADTLAELHHPGLVEIDEVGVHDGRTYLVMRLVEGEALSQRIDRGPLPPPEVIAIGAGLAGALGYIHDRGVVHRDVKPSNVLLDAGRVPHLTDFGVSKLVDATRITATGSVVGTPAYMAPEQVRGQEVGPAADVYALGLVLIEALTGMREFPGSVVESAVARLHRDPVVPPVLPAELRTLLTAMTAQDPANRPAASAVARRLQWMDPATAVVVPPPPHRRHVRVAVAASALVAATAVVIAGLVPAARAPVAVPQAVPLVSGPTSVQPTAAPPIASAATPSSPGVAEVADRVTHRGVPAARLVLDADETPGTAFGSPGGDDEQAGSTEEEPSDSTAGKAAKSKVGDGEKGKKSDGEKE